MMVACRKLFIYLFMFKMSLIQNKQAQVDPGIKV
jgi:hypothetical protein